MRRLLAPVLALILAPASLAATFSATVQTASPVTVASVTLTGDDQTKTFSIITQVAYTGGGDTLGWKVEATATTPTSGTHTLPALDVTAGTFACVTACTTSPTSTITYPITLSTTAVKIYNASANTGRGTYNITNTFQVTYPANIVTGTYSSTVTITGATGPT
jgi:lipopolysaccharide export system protein LptA